MSEILVRAQTLDRLFKQSLAIKVFDLGASSHLENGEEYNTLIILRDNDVTTESPFAQTVNIWFARGIKGQDLCHFSIGAILTHSAEIMSIIRTVHDYSVMKDGPIDMKVYDKETTENDNEKWQFEEWSNLIDSCLENAMNALLGPSLPDTHPLMRRISFQMVERVTSLG